MMETLFKNAGIWPIRLSESNSVAAMMQIALSGIGICVIPSVVVKPQLAVGQLKVLDTEAPLLPLEFYVTYLNNPFNDIPALIAKIAFDVSQQATPSSDKRR
jgi:DNA-binding transcriptional LysR family regulator